MKLVSGASAVGLAKRAWSFAVPAVRGKAGLPRRRRASIPPIASGREEIVAPGGVDKNAGGGSGEGHTPPADAAVDDALVGDVARAGSAPPHSITIKPPCQGRYGVAARGRSRASVARQAAAPNATKPMVASATRRFCRKRRRRSITDGAAV